MLVYNNKKEFIGIDEATLRKIGYNNISELKEDVVDFADLFENKPGFLHNFKNFSWIDFIIHSEQDNINARIRCNGHIYQCGFEIEVFYLANVAQGEEKSFSITLTDIRNLGQDEGSTPRELHEPESLESLQTTFPGTKPTATPKPAPIEQPQSTQPEPLELSFDSDPEPDPVPEMMEQTQSLEMPSEPEKLSIDFDEPMEVETITEPSLVSEPESFDVPDNITLETSNDYVYDPSIAADELGLPTDLIDEFVGDFIIQAKKFKPEIEEAIEKEDFNTIQILSHKLKGVAANLRIEDALEVLTTINASKEIPKLKDYMQVLFAIIHKLEHGSDAPQKTVAIEPTSDQDEDIYNFDLIDNNDSIQSEETFDDSDDFNDTIDEEPLEIPDFEDEIPTVADLPMTEPEEITASLSKESIATELDITPETLTSYINDFTTRANDLKSDLEDALKSSDFERVQAIAGELKGMSEALHLDQSSQYLSVLQKTTDINEAIKNAKSLFIFIREL